MAERCHQSLRIEQAANVNPNMAPGIIAPREWPKDPRIPQPAAMINPQAKTKQRLAPVLRLGRNEVCWVAASLRQEGS